MRIIKKLSKQIEAEVDGVCEYIVCALDLKGLDQELSKTYYDLARTEYSHVQKLHDQVVRKIREAESMDVEPPQWMLNKWDEKHRAIIEKMERAATLLDMYK